MCRGFTLVEALVALTILVIVAMAFVPLIAQGFSEVFLAGYRIQAIHEAQGPVDAQISSGASGDMSPLVISFSVVGSYTVQGEVFEHQVDFQDRSTSVTVFIPE